MKKQRRQRGRIFQFFIGAPFVAQSQIVKRFKRVKKTFLTEHRTCGALNNALTAKYLRHHPEEGLLYRTVETYWPLFLWKQERVGRTLPIFIKDEFEKFLKSGIPEFGFVRTYCHQCRESGVGGFSLNARVWVGGRDREKLEKLIRYMVRGPIATERLSESFPNLLIYKMKTTWRDGTTHVSFSLKESTIFSPLKIVREREPPDPTGGFKNEFDQRESW